LLLSLHSLLPLAARRKSRSPLKLRLLLPPLLPRPLRLLPPPPTPSPLRPLRLPLPRLLTPSPLKLLLPPPLPLLLAPPPKTLPLPLLPTPRRSNLFAVEKSQPAGWLFLRPASGRKAGLSNGQHKSKAPDTAGALSCR
jgi:hypothetical protein